jgi:hypothetical protein
MRKLVAFIALSPLLTGAARADLFTPDGSFTVDAQNSPGTFTIDATLGSGEQALTDGLFLTVNTVNVGQNEWLVFQYNVSDAPLSSADANWHLFETGLPATTAVSLVNNFVQMDVSGVNQTFTGSIFGNLSPAAAPPSDLAGILSGPGLLNNNPTLDAPIGGPGALPQLGTFISPYSQIESMGLNPATVTSYTEALEFAPTNPTPGVPEPSTWAMMLTGFGLLGFAATRKSKREARLAV